MDIMNNMTVSTSKLTFSLIAISALLISGSGFMVQDASALAPTFTAKHLNTTATELTFNEVVNGTLSIQDWSIFKYSCVAPCLVNSAKVIGESAYTFSQVTVSDVNNGTAPSEADTVKATTIVDPALGFINDSVTLYLIHEAISSDATYFINYTQHNAVNAPHAGQFVEAHEKVFPIVLTNKEVVPIGFNATGIDWMAPTIVSADILKSTPQRLTVTMSENVANVNSTTNSNTPFKIVKSSGTGNDIIPHTVTISNSTTNLIYIDFKNTVNPGDVLTLSYTTTTASADWITDALPSTRYGIPTGTTGATDYAHGNRLANFTGTTPAADSAAFDVLGMQITRAAINIVNWMEVGMFGDVTTCYDCAPPSITEVKVSLDSSVPITITNDNPVHINAGLGDTVSVMVTVTDNLGADTIPFAGLYTNFGETPDNLYYSNNFDALNQKSTSYYEWNVRNDDVAFDNDGAITWNDAIAKVNSDRTQTFTYTMTINDAIESSQVWVDLGDKSANYAKLQLPIILEVSGAPAITFASDDTQKVVSFFNESILLAIVSQWTATSSDDASNVEQLSSVLGIESQLPTWTTELASWVADDKIDVADMIVAVEYVINL